MSEYEKLLERMQAMTDEALQKLTDAEIKKLMKVKQLVLAVCE